MPLVILTSALEWLERFKGDDTFCDHLTTWIVHICLQQFRVDVLNTVTAEIVEPYRPDAQKSRSVSVLSATAHQGAATSLANGIDVGP